MTDPDPFAPRQARSRRTRKKLLDALEALLKEQSFDTLDVTGIARRAGVSPASIYRRFGRKHGLLKALYALQVERVQHWIAQPDVQARMAALQEPGVDLRGFLRGQMRLAVKQLREIEHLARPMAIYGRLRPEIFGEEADHHLDAAHENLSEALTRFGGEIRRQDWALAARFLTYLVQTSLNDFVLFRDRTVLPNTVLDDDAFADHIADFAYGYLTTPD